MPKKRWYFGMISTSSKFNYDNAKGLLIKLTYE